jgi:hypothetical protein
MLKRLSSATFSWGLIAACFIGGKATAQTPQKTAQPLPPVTITDPIAVFLHEFESRRQRGIGHYVTMAELRAGHGRALPDILASKIPGVRFTNDGMPYSTRGPNNFSGRCAVAVWYNGVRAAAPPIEMISHDLLGGIEYYNPGYTPVQYRDGASACGVMLIWSGF